MSVENYNNPGSLNPYGDWAPRGGLTGWMYQDKVNDYQKSRDISNQAGLLSNVAQGQKNDEFTANAPVRAGERQVNLGNIGNTLALQPGQQQLAMGEQQAAIKDQPFQNETKLFKAINELPEAQRDKALKDTTATSSILRSLPPDTDPQVQFNALEKAGIPTGRWQGKDPEAMQKDFNYLRSIDPEMMKHQQQMAIEQLKSKTDMYKADKMYQGRVDVAKMRADTMRDISSGKMNEQQLFDKFNEVSAKPEEERTPKEQQLVDNFWDYKSAAAQVKDQAAAKKPADTIQELENMKKRQDAFTTDPSIPKGAKLGPYDTKKKKYEVQDKDGHVMGWF